MSYRIVYIPDYGLARKDELVQLCKQRQVHYKGLNKDAVIQALEDEDEADPLTIDGLESYTLPDIKTLTKVFKISTDAKRKDDLLRALIDTIFEEASEGDFEAVRRGLRAGEGKEEEEGEEEEEEEEEEEDKSEWEDDEGEEEGGEASWREQRGMNTVNASDDEQNQQSKKLTEGRGKHQTGPEYGSPEPGRGRRARKHGQEPIKPPPVTADLISFDEDHAGVGEALPEAHDQVGTSEKGRRLTTEDRKAYARAVGAQTPSKGANTDAIKEEESDRGGKPLTQGHQRKTVLRPSSKAPSRKRPGHLRIHQVPERREPRARDDDSTQYSEFSRASEDVENVYNRHGRKTKRQAHLRAHGSTAGSKGRSTLSKGFRTQSNEPENGSEDSEAGDSGYYPSSASTLDITDCDSGQRSVCSGHQQGRKSLGRPYGDRSRPQGDGRRQKAWPNTTYEDRRRSAKTNRPDQRGTRAGKSQGSHQSIAQEDVHNRGSHGRLPKQEAPVGELTIVKTKLGFLTGARRIGRSSWRLFMNVGTLDFPLYQIMTWNVFAQAHRLDHLEIFESLSDNLKQEIPKHRREEFSLECVAIFPHVLTAKAGQGSCNWYHVRWDALNPETGKRFVIDEWVSHTAMLGVLGKVDGEQLLMDRQQAATALTVRNTEILKVAVRNHVLPDGTRLNLKAMPWLTMHGKSTAQQLALQMGIYLPSGNDDSF